MYFPRCVGRGAVSRFGEGGLRTVVDHGDKVDAVLGQDGADLVVAGVRQKVVGQGHRHLGTETN